MAALQDLARAYLQDFPQEGVWELNDCDTASYTEYKAVDIRGVEIVLSQAYLMARTRVSYFVRVDYEGEGTYVARISKYLRVSKVGADGTAHVLRIAVADLFKTELKRGYQGLLMVVKDPHGAGRRGGLFRRDYPMGVGHIQHKLVFYDAAKAGNDNYKLKLWGFAAYSNTYTKRAPDLE